MMGVYQAKQQLLGRAAGASGADMPRIISIGPGLRPWATVYPTAARVWRNKYSGQPLFRC